MFQHWMCYKLFVCGAETIILGNSLHVLPLSLPDSMYMRGLAT